MESGGEKCQLQRDNLESWCILQSGVQWLLLGYFAMVLLTFIWRLIGLQDICVCLYQFYKLGIFLRELFDLIYNGNAKVNCQITPAMRTGGMYLNLFGFYDCLKL